MQPITMTNLSTKLQNNDNAMQLINTVTFNINLRVPVSYTHLDVYKRQGLDSVKIC